MNDARRQVGRGRRDRARGRRRCRSSRARSSVTARRDGGDSTEMAAETQAITTSQDRRRQAQPSASRSPLRAVVIGGSGQIGGWLLRILAERGHSAVGTFASVPFPGLVQLDAAELQSAADWITGPGARRRLLPGRLHLGRRVRARSPAGLRGQPASSRSTSPRRPPQVGARFVYFSTDYVFDGQDGPYSEDSATHPLSVYGQAKRDAELELERDAGRPAAHDPHVLGLRARAARQELRLSAAPEPGREEADGLSRGPGFQSQLRARRGPRGSLAGRAAGRAG